MIKDAGSILDDYAEGRTSRREAVLLIASMAVGSATAKARTVASGSAVDATSPTFRATALNHIGLRVTDVARSRDFYRRHLGVSVIRDHAPGNCFLRVGNNYMGLFRAGTAAMDHYCFTVADYDAEAAMTRCAEAGLRPRRDEDRVYFDDPDGLEIQLDSRFGSWPGTPPTDVD